MKNHIRTSSLLPFGFLALAVISSPQPLLAVNNCKAVDADQAVTVTGPATTTGTITRGGILNGTTADIITSPFSPTADPNTFSFTDTLTITTDKGTITTSDVAIFDVAAGVFSSISKITSGTGIFAGATGTLFISGSTTDFVNFEDRIIGEVCLAQ